MNSPKPKTQVVAKGVDSLIDRIREEGVNKGKSEADQIIAEAKKQAEAELKKAQKEADAYFIKRKTEIETLENSLGEELRSVFRDNLLKMKEDLVKQFTQKIQRLISETTTDEDFLQRMILEIVGKQRASVKVDDARAVEVLLPDDVVGLDNLRKSPEQVREGSLGQFVMQQTGELLRDGITFSSSKDIKGGIKVFLKDEKVTIDISDKALADMVMTYLQPRFRVLFEGVVN
ncbi:MAG: hypothetical protein ACLFP8_01690 [Alphaproteobacteria bacterium]